MDEEQPPANQAEIDEYLREMNTAWKLYHHLEMEQPFAPKAASDAVAAQFTRACYRLETCGIKWLDLPYNSETKTFSLPDR